MADTLPLRPAPVNGSTAAEPVRHEPNNAAAAPHSGARRLMRPPELAALLSVSVKTLERLRAAKKIGPRAICLSAQALRYDPAEVEAWLEHRDRNGQLYDAQAWPAVWQQLQRRGR